MASKPNDDDHALLATDDHSIPPPPLTMVAASYYVPKLNLEKPLGEDAHFISIQQGNATFGIADGVGGCAKNGVDAGVYARELMNNAAVIAVQHEGSTVNPKRVLEQAFLHNKTTEGSSTACIITLTPNNTLKAANVGDSGFCVVRGGKIVYESPVQQRRFNHPYQLGINADDPSVADEIEIPVEKGDVIVAGTDGLFDNMEIVEILKKARRQVAIQGGLLRPKELAHKLGKKAVFNSYDRYKETPFSRAAKKAGFKWEGGKIDDITVIAACIH